MEEDIKGWVFGKMRPEVWEEIKNNLENKQAENQYKMIETVEQLKQERPDLVKLFENMSREQLLEQIYKESLDAINMEERVQTFMNECTNMSKTTYPPEVIKTLIQDKYKQDISNFCEMVLEDMDGMEIDEIKDYLKQEIID